jgi:hypothetical protein
LFSSEPEAKQQYNKARTVLRGIKDTCFLSKERLYLANSEFLVEQIIKFEMLESYPQLFLSEFVEEIKKKLAR